MSLSLFHFDSCSYCRRVRRALDDLGVEVQLVDVNHDPKARADLIEATGRATVPVLRILEPQERWLPESADIVRYLYERFGNGRRPPLSVRLNPRVVIVVVLVVGFALLQLLR
jgi:glutathione S-transferase